MQDSIVTIGGFDGVHLGHQSLISRARALAERATQTDAPRSHHAPARPRVCVLVLDPSPATLLRPESVRPIITPFEERQALLLAAGADMVTRINVTKALLELTPAEFLDAHLRPLSPVGIVAGPDFRFGKERAGDIALVRSHFARPDFLIDIAPELTVPLGDHTLVPARSTLVRWLLSHGRVSDAARLLGRPHALVGTVIRGDRRGRSIGFPTVNIDTACMLPGDAVYAARATLPDGRSLAAALSVGVKPTFPGAARAAEAFLFDPHRSNSDFRLGSWAALPGLPEYGWPIRVDLIAWVREQYRFSGPAALVEQIERDCALVARLVEHSGFIPAPQELHA